MRLSARVSGASIGPLDDGAMRGHRDNVLHGLCDCHQRMWLPSRVSEALTRGGIKSLAGSPIGYSATTQSPDRQVKLAIAPTPPRHFSLSLGLPPVVA